MMNFNQMMPMFQNFMSNPMTFLAKKNLRIPQELQSNPQGIIQYLMNSGTMSQQQYNQLQSMAKNFQSMMGGKQ